MPPAHRLLDQFIDIVDLSHRRDGKAAQMGTGQQRLGFIIGNTADPAVALEFGYIMFKFGSEGRVFDIVNRTVKALYRIIYGHSASSGPKM